MNRFREPVNGFTHLAGAILAAFGLVWLVIMTREDTTKMMMAAVYGVSMIALYLASATFHLTKASEKVLLWLRRFDHAAIYGMIAGTYTPILYTMLDGGWRWGMLALIWGMAGLGAIYKLFFLRHGGWFSLIFYVLMGWIGVIALPQAAPNLTAIFIALMVAGGSLYMLGAVIFGIQKPNFHPHFGHHEIWHLCVLGGSALHFAAILLHIGH